MEDSIMLDNTLSRWNLISKYIFTKERERREKEWRKKKTKEKKEWLKRKISKLKL